MHRTYKNTIIHKINNHVETHCFIQTERKPQRYRETRRNEPLQGCHRGIAGYHSTIRHIHVGFNVNPAEQWDICLDSEFDNLEDMKAYATHPAHLAAAGLLKDAKEGRACTDYEF